MMAHSDYTAASFPLQAMEALEVASSPSIKIPLVENKADEIQQNKEPFDLNPTPFVPTDSPIISSTKETLKDVPSPGIKYRVEYRDYDNDLVHSAEIDKHDFDITNQSHQQVFEIITTYRTNSAKFNKDVRSVPVVTDTRKKVRMVIHSQVISHALRSVVRYYPGQDLLGESISIPYPYPVLVHHEEELKEFHERCNPSRQTGPICAKERNAYEHLTLLLDFLEETVMPAVRSEKARNQKDLWTFDMLWLALKPGTTWRARLGGPDVVDEWTEMVIQAVSNGTFVLGDRPWRVQYWYMDFDGTWIGRCRDFFDKDRFEGEDSISPYYRQIKEEDLEHLEELEEEHGELLEKEVSKIDKTVVDLISQGKKFYDLLQGKCQGHNGKTVGFPFSQVEGLVMADLKTYYLGTKGPDVTVNFEENTLVSDCLCSVCKERQDQALERMPTSFVGYDGISLDDPDSSADFGDSLTSHQYLLLPKNTRAFVFKTRVWELLRIKNLSEPKFEPRMMDTLVMDPVRRHTLTALAGSYIRENKYKEKSTLPPWNADFVQGKGQGQIFLLHGKPGVGKTYTAECIAQYTNRPLMVLTSSDIGTRPEDIERILMAKFKMAAGWGAILLIDEADVFMEQRSTNDLTRNSLVAGFLRALEFYDGILFLTTNRVGMFDDAFISRIHVKLYYPDFTDVERQQIWKTFMDKLVRDRGKFIRVTIDAKDYIKGNKIKEVEWNGREIRNAFQTAVALAEYEADKDEEGKILLKDTHLSAMVDMSQDFKKYLVRVHGVDENKRALIQGNRNDLPEKEKK